MLLSNKKRENDKTSSINLCDFLFHDETRDRAQLDTTTQLM